MGQIDPLGLEQELRLKYRLTKSEFSGFKPKSFTIMSEYYVYVEEECKTKKIRNNVINNPVNSLKPHLRINHADLLQIDEENEKIPAVTATAGWDLITEEHLGFYSDDPDCNCSESFGGGKYDNGIYGLDELGARLGNIFHNNYKADYKFINPKD